MLRPLLFTLLCGGLLGTSLSAQDPVFSQFIASPLQINPAFAGITYAPRVAVNYRSQWGNVPNAYSTFAASFEQFVPELNSGFGLFVQGDQAGDVGGESLISTNWFKAVYGYKVQVSRDFNVKFGVEAGYTQHNINWDALVFTDQLDRLTGSLDVSGNPNPTQEQRPDATNTGYLDIGAGVLAYTPAFYVGVSLKHLNTPYDGVLRINENLQGGLPMRISVHGGGNIVLRKGSRGKPGTFVSPNVLVVKQSSIGQVNAGSLINVDNLFGGLWYRHAFTNPDAVIALVGVQYYAFKFGYSYDLTVGPLTQSASGGSHELSVVLNFDNSVSSQRRRRAARYNDCFQIFR